MNSLPGFLKELENADIRLTADGDRLLFEAPDGAMTDDLREEIRRRKPQLLELLRKRSGRPDGVVSRSASGWDAGTAVPLSHSQRRLWFLDQLHPGGCAYNIPFHFVLDGLLNVEALSRACNDIIARHEVLRTRFVARDGEVHQEILPTRPVDVGVENCHDLTHEEWEQHQRREISSEARGPFSLSDGPLVRIKVLRRSRDQHLLLVTMHHIVSDGWSLGVFVRELESLYRAQTGRPDAGLPPLAIQYADFAVWQNSWLTGERLRKLIGFWRAHLTDNPEVLTLPLDHPRPVVQSYKGASHSFTLPRALAMAARTTSERQNVTLFSLLMAAFHLLLHRYSGQRRVNIGFPVANRTRSELEPLIGFFVNTLIVPASMDEDLSFRRFTAKVSEAVISAQEHQELPYEKLVEELQPPRSTAYNPLFQAMFSLNPPTPVLRLPNIQPAALRFEYASAKVDLSLFIEDDGDELRAVLTYSTALFEEPRMRDLLSNYAAVLEWCISHPDRRLSEMPLNTGAPVEVRSQQRDPQRSVPGEQAAPQNALEEMIAGIWRTALRLDRVSVVENFFDLGGHSLLLMQVQGKLSTALNRSIPVVDLFQFPTIRGLARHLEGGTPERDSVAGAYARARMQRVAMARLQRSAARDSL